MKTSMKLISDAFTEGQPIPARYTCDDAEVKPRATKRQLPNTMHGHILAEASLMGAYQRRR